MGFSLKNMISLTTLIRYQLLKIPQKNIVSVSGHILNIILSQSKGGGPKNFRGCGPGPLIFRLIWCEMAHRLMKRMFFLLVDCNCWENIQELRYSPVLRFKEFKTYRA